MFFNSFFRYFLYLTGTKFILAPYVYDKDTGEYEKMQLLDKHSNAKVKRKVRMAGNE